MLAPLLSQLALQIGVHQHGSLCCVRLLLSNTQMLNLLRRCAGEDDYLETRRA